MITGANKLFTLGRTEYRYAAESTDIHGKPGWAQMMNHVFENRAQHHYLAQENTAYGSPSRSLDPGTNHHLLAPAPILPTWPNSSFFTVLSGHLESRLP